jgi:hypothetical protein
MAVFDVLVNTDDLVVLGPPDVIDVSVSIGEKGNRGATFYAGSGNPNVLSVSQNIFGETVTPVSGDIFINTAVGDEYGWLYIYNPKVVGNQWDQVLKLQPPIYSSKSQVVFSSGLATISIPLSNIISTNFGLTAENFNVTMTPINSDPTVLTINSVSINGSNLDIVVEAMKYASSTWSQLSQTIFVSINIVVV